MFAFSVFLFLVLLIPFLILFAAFCFAAYCSLVRVFFCQKRNRKKKLLLMYSNRRRIHQVCSSFSCFFVPLRCVALSLFSFLFFLISHKQKKANARRREIIYKFPDVFEQQKKKWQNHPKMKKSTSSSASLTTITSNNNINLALFCQPFFRLSFEACDVLFIFRPFFRW